MAKLDSSDKPLQIVVRGNSADPQWSPDGTKLVFVSARTDHAFIAVYDPSNKSLRYLSPSVDSDQTPRWSPDGKSIAFVRRPAAQRDKPEGFFIAPDVPEPWAVWIADASSASAREIWHSGKELSDSFPAMAADTGGGVLNWVSNDRAHNRERKRRLAASVFAGRGRKKTRKSHSSHPRKLRSGAMDFLSR